MAVADVNGDGHPDLLVVNYCASSSDCSNGTVGVLLGNGDGTFQAAVSCNSGGYYAYSVAVADVNGDGHPDLLVALSTVPWVCCWATATAPFKRRSATTPAASMRTSIAVADVNGDGNPDVLVTNGVPHAVARMAAWVCCWATATAPSKRRSATTPAATMRYSVAVADVNGDGKPDLLVAN